MRGRWYRYVTEVLQEEPYAWHLALHDDLPHRAKYAQRRLKALGVEAVIEWHGLTSCDLFARWSFGFKPGDPRNLG